MSRQQNHNYPGLVSPVTPLWAAAQKQRTSQRQKLLPSAMEINTPPNTIIRKQGHKSKKRKPNGTALMIPQEMITTVGPPGAANHSRLPMAVDALPHDRDPAMPHSASLYPSNHPGGYMSSTAMMSDISGNVPHPLSQSAPHPSTGRQSELLDTAGTYHSQQSMYTPAALHSISPQGVDTPVRRTAAASAQYPGSLVPVSPMDVNGSPLPSHHLYAAPGQYSMLQPPPSQAAFMPSIHAASMDQVKPVMQPQAPPHPSVTSQSMGHQGTTPSHYQPSAHYRPAPAADQPPQGAYPVMGMMSSSTQSSQSHPALATHSSLAQAPLQRQPSAYAGRSALHEASGYEQPLHYQQLAPSTSPEGTLLPKGSANQTFARPMYNKRSKPMPPRDFSFHSLSAGAHVRLGLDSKLAPSQSFPQPLSPSRNPYDEYNHYIMRHAADTKSKVIWSPEVEVVFMEALWLIPGEPTKVVMNQRARGRNELISDYMRYRLGEYRSRKQVSSHLQVLKKLLQHDETFLDLVGPKKTTRPDDQAHQVKSKLTLETTSVEQLISKLKELKKNEKKPQFLRQAEANCENAKKALSSAQADDDHRADSGGAGHDPANTSHSPQLKGHTTPMSTSTSPVMHHGEHASTDAPSGQMHHSQQSPEFCAQFPRVHHFQPPQHFDNQQSSEPQQLPRRVQHSSQLSVDTESLSSSSSPDMRASMTTGVHGGTMIESNNSMPVGLPTPLSATHPHEPVMHANTMSLGGNSESHLDENEEAPGVQLKHPESTESEGADMANNEYPPLLQPRPVQSNYKMEPLIAPSASVPPVQPVSIQASPRRNRHRRTTSASVELSGDKVLPIQFSMVRRTENSHRVYSRLLRAAYESPLRPLKIQHLLPDYSDLQELYDQSKLVDVPVVHGSVSIFINDPQPGFYASDVQYMLSGGDVNSGYRYYAKTVITSRKELLRCQFPCPFQQISGRGLEEDKDVLNVPFLPDFWDDFLHRLEISGKEYAKASLSALKMYQAIYRIGNGKEELSFVTLYRFSAADDEFSARTRFRRVKNTTVSSSNAPPQYRMPTLNVNESENRADVVKSEIKMEPFPKLEKCEDDDLPRTRIDEPATPTRRWHHENGTRDNSAQRSQLQVSQRQQPNNYSHHRRTDSALFAQLLGTPTPRPRSSSEMRSNGASESEHSTPKTNQMAGMLPTLGMGTPNQTLSMLGNSFSFDSPSTFASPRRYNLDTFDLGCSPFSAVLSQEVRQSPRSSRLDIQRPMTAFEPQAWDEMHDWIYQ